MDENTVPGSLLVPDMVYTTQPEDVCMWGKVQRKLLQTPTKTI